MYLKKAKSPIKVNVYEIGLDEIKYRPWGDTIIPMLVIPRENISKLELANGSVFEFKESPMTDASNYIEQHNNAIKFGVFSPLNSNLAFSYERGIKPGRSFEVGIGIVGLGVKYQDVNVKGGFGRIGYKFITSPDYYYKGMKYSHILKGGYLKPEIVFGGYGIDRQNYYYTKVNSGSSYYSYNQINYVTYRRHVTFGALILNFGKQWIVDDLLAFDLFMGLGYGYSEYTQNPDKRSYYYDDDEPEMYHYAFFGGVKDFRVVITAGFKVGYVFGKQKEKAYK
jgi:hypothetical protein